MSSSFRSMRNFSFEDWKSSKVLWFRGSNFSRDFSMKSFSFLISSLVEILTKWLRILTRICSGFSVIRFSYLKVLLRYSNNKSIWDKMRFIPIKGSPLFTIKTRMFSWLFILNLKTSFDPFLVKISSHYWPKFSLRFSKTNSIGLKRGSISRR